MVPDPPRTSTILQDFKTFVRERQGRLRREAIAKRFYAFTMTPRHIFADNLKLVESVKKIPGCVVECGVWRGGMSAGMATVLGPERSYYLYDTFEGLPAPKLELDGQKALDYQNDVDSPWYFENCSAAPEFAQQAMTLSGATKVRLIKGTFQDTLPVHLPEEPIAVLRLDGDWYESTMICLEHLFHRVQPGGLVIIDDYFAWDGCLRAVHDFLSRNAATERIRSLGKICHFFKQPPAAQKSDTPAEAPAAVAADRSNHADR